MFGAGLQDFAEEEGNIVNLRIQGALAHYQPKNILLTRLSAIGDCVLTIPLAVAAKRLWPQCKLTWIVDCAAEQLLVDHPAVDEVLRIERKWLQRPSRWSSLRGELRSRAFDLVLDPQGLSKSSLLGWISGARRRVGFDYSQAREIAPLIATHRIARTSRHMVDAYLQLLSPWSPHADGLGEFAMPIYQKAAASVEKMLRDLELSTGSDSGRNWIAINPGAGWTTKQWPVERFAQLAKQLVQKHHRPALVFWSGKDELLMAQVIAEESGGAARLAPATNLCELLEMLRRCSLLVCGDTGPLHIASSIGTPSVSLHGPTWADECGPYGNRAVAIQSPAPHLSGKPQRHGANLAMQAIELDEVSRACDRMLAQEAATARLAA